MIPAAELRVLVGVYGLTEANKKLLRFDADLKALASSDPMVTLHAEVDPTGFEEFGIYKSIAEESITTSLHAEVDDAGFEAFGIKKAIAEEGVTSTLQTLVDDVGFEDFALKKHIASEEVTAELHAEATGFATVVAQLDAIRGMAKAPIVQEVKLKIDKSSLATLGAEEAAIGALNGNGNGHSNGNGNGDSVGAFLGGLLTGRNGGKGIVPTLAWGSHSPGSGGALPWWGRLLMGGGLLAGAGSLGSFAGFGAEHFLFTGMGLAGSAGAGLAGGGLLGAGALGTMAVGGGSDMAVMASTIADTKELGKLYATLQEQVALYGAHSKQAAVARAHLHLAMREMGPAAKPELKLAKQAEGLDKFWDHQTQNARIQASKILSQVVGLGHDYVPLVAHAAERNLAIVNKGLKPLFSWLEGPEGTGVFEHLENEFAHNLPTAMHALDQGVQFVLKTISTASNYTGGFIHTVDDFFTKWNEPQNFQKWEGEIGHLVGDFHLWLNLIKALGTDIFDLFSQDAGTGKAIVVTITEMLHHLDEWERSTEGKAELHNLFVLHREEIIELLHVIPPLIGAIEPIYMTVAPFMTEAMTEVLGVVGDLLKTLDETGPITRWALGLGLIASKLFGVKTVFGGLWKVLKGDSLASLFAGQASAEERVAAASEQVAVSTDAAAAANERLAASMEAIAAAGGIEGVAVGGAAVPAAGGAAAAGAETTAAETAAGGAAGFAGRALTSPFAKAGAVAAGYFATEFAAKLLAPGALEGQNLEEAIFHGFNTKEVARTEARALATSYLREVHNALAQGGDPTAIRGRSHTQAVTIHQEQREALRSEASVLEGLQSGVVTRMGDIRRLAQEGSTAAAVAFGQGSPQWRKASADNMLAAVGAIKAGESAGLISTEEGQKEIAHYLREYHLLTGNDPFHIASAFTHTWAEAGRVNETGISQALAGLRRLPPVSQAIAEQTMLHQVKAFEQGGQLVKGTFSRLRSAIVTQLQQTREHGGAQVQRFAAEFDGSFGMLSVNVAKALENIGLNVGTLLSKLGAHNPLQNFTLHYIQGHGVSQGAGRQYLGELPEMSGHQSGGFTVPGHSTGDRHPYLLPHESFIMNQRATAAYGLQRGGMSPVLLESGERVFLPHEVNAVGAHRLERMNGAIPRFQHGGMLGPEPHLQGQKGPLLDLGQHAIHTGYAAAQHYLGTHAKHGPHANRPGGSSSSYSGHALTGKVSWFNGGATAGGSNTSLPGVALNLHPGTESGWNNPTTQRFMQDSQSGHPDYIRLTIAGHTANLPITDLGPAGFTQRAIDVTEGGVRKLGFSTAAFPTDAVGKAIFLQLGGLLGFAGSGHLTSSDYLARKWAGWDPSGRYYPLRRRTGGLIEQEEHAAGVPGSHHKPHEHATPSDAVHWAMRHLGDSDQWGYPGEWCGAFIAADMKAQELPVPPGYPAAASWATYGTPLGRNHIQAGAVLDYGSAHVALAISSSEQIQGNDIHGQVGTSGIGGVIGGSPLTAVRWPPYGSGPGAGAKPTETVPGVFHGAHTHSLSFPGVPKTLHAVEREIRRWTRELHVYEAAVKAAKGRPELLRKLQANVTKIQKYLRELARARHKLRTQAARKRYSGHIAKQLGSITSEEKSIELAQRAYNMASQRAEQVVDLEPTEPILSPNASEAEQRKAQEDYAHAYEAYVEQQEGPAYGRVLETEAGWRNTILGAEAKASGLESGWEGQTRSKMAEIASIQHFSDEVVKERERVLKQLHQFEHDHPKAKLPTDLADARDKMQRDLHTRQDLLEKIPTLRFQERELRKVIGEGRAEFWGGYESQATARKGSKAPPYLRAALADRAIQPPAVPLPGTGSFEQSLEEVQGLHWPGQHERLAVLPAQRAVGSFGGAIWDTQSSIEELGLKNQQAASSLGGVGGGAGAGSGNAEREHLLEELLLQAHQREAVGEIERQTLSSARLLPYAGGYEAGGHVAALVGEQGPELIETRPGAYIRNASETSSLLSPKVEVHYYEGERRAEVKVNGKPVDRSDVEEIVHKMDRRGSYGARRGIARAGS